MSDENVDKLVKNFEKFKGLCAKLGDRSEPIGRLLSDFEERLILAPALISNKFEQAQPGGLVEHSLKTLVNFRKLLELYQVPFPMESMIIVSLFHDIGRLGSLEHELYIPEQENWRREKFGLYRINDALPHMSMPLRSLWLLQQYGVQLTLDEFQCIAMVDGMYAESNRQYAGNEPRVVILFQQAELNSMRAGKLERPS